MSAEELSSDMLAEIQQLAYAYMLRQEIAVITGVAIDRLLDENDAAGEAFLRGRLMRKAEFNMSLITLTKQLSSPAMAIEYKVAESVYLNDQKIT